MRKARRKSGLSDKCIEKNLEQIIAVSQKEGVVVDPFSISSRKTVYECPYDDCSKEFEARALLHHLSSHSSQKKCLMNCPFCDKRMSSLLLAGHLENNHPELNVKNELNELNSAIDPKHKSVRDSIKSSERSSKRQSLAAGVSATLGFSIFDPSPSNIPFSEFRASLRSKLIESTKENGRLIFKFAVRTNALEWGCLICPDSIGLSFKNPISLRLHALFHLEKHVNVEYFDHLQGMITKEWDVLKQEMPTLPIDRMRTRDDLPTKRSFLAYSLLRDDDCVGEVMDVIDKGHVDEPTKKLRNALCLVCHSPFFVSLSTPLTTPNHFHLDSHRHLNAKGWSEFQEVDEIAEIVHEEENDIQSALAFSSFLLLTDELDAIPKKLFKWRCTLCSLDVAVFPSYISLRFFALRHLETEHTTTFNDHFYRHEWNVLQMETSLVSMRRFSQTTHIQQKGRPLDITDPSDFLFPWSRCLRVPTSEYYTCGYCFFVSTATDIKDHLTTHGYVGAMTSRLVVEDGEQKAIINEREIRRIRKGLSVPTSILYSESMEDVVKEEKGVPLPPSTPLARAKSVAMAPLMDTPKSKYTLRARSVVTRYIPIEEETANNETMSSDESDSGLEKNYHTMSGDDTMEDTGEEEEGMMETTLRSATSSFKKKESVTKNSNTCTESSVTLEDLYDAGISPTQEREGGGERKREREKVHEKAFKWEGTVPPQLTAEQVELIREFKEGGRCTLCPRTKGYRGVGRMVNVEQSMMAHLIVNHADNTDAMAIVTRKRYLLSMSLEKGGSMEKVPPFLLQSVHPHHLTCSRCMIFKCSKQSNLVIHWETCKGVMGNRGRSANKIEEGEGERKKMTPKRVFNSVRCPLCREGWRKSTHYSDDVSVAIHLLLKHTTDEKAYTMAMQIEEETNVQSSFPFIHLSDSFALRAEQADSGIQCALCDNNSQSLAVAIRHATRSHATVKQKIEANFLPGALSCPLSSCSIKLKCMLIGRSRSLATLQFVHVLFNHDKDDKEAIQFMNNISNEDAEQLRTEVNIRLNVEECVQRWLAGTPRLVCDHCSHSSHTLSLHVRHFEDKECGEEKDRMKRRSSRGRSVPTMMTPRKKEDMEMSSIEALAEMATPKRGRGRAPEIGRPCAHCARVIYASDWYAPSISMDIHLLKMHPEKERSSSPSIFPFIDFSRSSEDSLQCSLCEYTAKESRYFIPHAWTKHTQESQREGGMAAWAEYEMNATKKREKQRINKRTRKEIKNEEMMRREEEINEEGKGEEGDIKRFKLDDMEATATAFIRTPRQRSTVSRWLETSLAGTSTYSLKTSTTKTEEDLRDRLDRLFSNLDSPATSQSQPQSGHASSSIFRELPEMSMSRMTSSGRAEDISHIKGIEGVRCSVCSFKGRDTEMLRIHFNEAHQEVASLSVPEVFPCAACSLVLNSKKKWRCHCEEDHTPKDRPFQCFKCQFRYETHQKLRAHQIRVHESEILVHPDDRTCRECNKLFGSLRAYQNHRKRHELRDRIAEEEEMIED